PAPMSPVHISNTWYGSSRSCQSCSTIPTIFFDESHNTGAALLDADQPVFTLASIDYNPDECAELMKSFFRKKR
ncbi:MAG: hypothetical protein MUE32_11060, partial [Bacteroidales bacterium]|nr:hypothetical protein [Bacteroidales bacterium]